MVSTDLFNIYVYDFIDPGSINGATVEMIDFEVTSPKNLCNLRLHILKDDALKLNIKLCDEYIAKVSELKLYIESELKKREEEKERMRCGIDWV